MATSKLQALWNHPAGPKTIHFWAPTFKWGISIANIADFAKPTDKISYPQQLVIWSRYSMVITPKNWNLFSVNVAMAGTGIYQLARKIKNKQQTVAAGEDHQVISTTVIFLRPILFFLIMVELRKKQLGLQ